MVVPGASYMAFRGFWDAAQKMQRKFYGRAGRALTNLVIDPASKRYIDHNLRVWPAWKQKHSNRVILVDLYGISETETARSYFLNILARRTQATIHSFSNRPNFNVAVRKIYRSFNVAGHITALWRLTHGQRRRASLIAEEILPKIRTKQDLFDLHVDGVWIGIDIYETYLSRFNEPTVRIEDSRLIHLVREAVACLVFWDDYFKTHSVQAVVTSHDVYVTFNAVCKTAYKYGVPVYLPNPVYLNKATEPFSCHRHFHRFREMFKTLTPAQQQSGLAWAKERLALRLSGAVGVDMPYSTASGFASHADAPPVLRKSDRLKVLICSHCFFDNPHAYGKMLFLDFHEWLSFLGEISNRTDYDWYLKMHPDPLPGTQEVLERILAKYPRITMIPHTTSHHQLAKEGVSYVLTAYGTVGQEYPAIGVQVINAAYNPRYAYDFNFHPKTIQEYEQLLLSLKTLEKKELPMDDLCEFYFMFYQFTLVDDMVMGSFKKYQEATGPGAPRSSAYVHFLDNWSQARHESIIRKMEEFIDSDKPCYFMTGPI